MLEWAVAIAAFAVLMLAMVRALARMKKTPRKGGGGVMIALGMVFASVFDPARAAASEIVDKQKDIEGSEEGESGDRPE
jgi:hypothetical protein